MAEEITLKEGLSMTVRLGCDSIIVALDSMETIINACFGEDMWWSDLAAIFADYVDLISSIGNISFKHHWRKTNKVVHELVRVCFLY